MDALNNLKPLRLLTDGYKTQFATFVFESEGFTELLMDKAHQFVDNELDVIQDDDVRLELAMMLMESIKLGNY